MCVTL